MEDFNLKGSVFIGIKQLWEIKLLVSSFDFEKPQVIIIMLSIINVIIIIFFPKPNFDISNV